MEDRNVVFISYAHEDERWLDPIRRALRPYRFYERVCCWSDRDILPGQPWDREIQAAIRRARVALLLVSQDFFGSDYIVEHELPQLLADAALGKVRLLWVAVEAFDPELVSESGLGTYQAVLDPQFSLGSLSGELRPARVVEIAVRVKEAFFRDAGVGSRVVSRQRAAAYREAAALRVDEAAGLRVLASLFGVPALDAEHYVARTEGLASLRGILLAGTELAAGLTSEARAGEVGLHGMGGMGKTVMAQAFCHDPAVRSAFPDGIYWVTLGEDAEVAVHQRQLLTLVDSDASGTESGSRVRERLRHAFAGKRALLVIDDLWRVDDFHALDIMSGASRVLITTRDAGLLGVIGARIESVSPMSGPLALSLLAEWAGIEGDALPESAGRVAELCGYLPLALALAGAQVADGVPWATIVQELEHGRIEFLDHEYGSVFGSLARSLDALSPFERARYLELAVFPEDARIPPETIARLWGNTGHLGAADVERLLSRFWKKALLIFGEANGLEYVGFHDLQLDFLRMRAEPPAFLSDVLLQAHRQTLRLPDGVAGWAALPPGEPYLWDRLAAHLVEANREDELRTLLLTPEWIFARLAASSQRGETRPGADVTALLSDYDLLVADPQVALVRRTLRMSAHVIAEHPCQAGAQLFGRLGNCGDPEVRAFAWAAHESDAGTGLVPKHPALLAPGPLVLTLTGHGAGVEGAAVLEDGKRALSWSLDQTLRVWDLERGEEIERLVGHERGVDGAMMLADGRRVMSWSRDHTLRLWDLERREQLLRMEGHQHWVEGAAVLSDGRRALSWSWDGTLRVWELDDGAELHRLEGHERRVAGAVVLPDGRRALSWSWDRTLRMWDLESGKELQRLEGHEHGVAGASVLADGLRAISWSVDGTLRVWDVESGGELQRLQGHEQRVAGALLSSDQRRALSWSVDGTLCVWDLHDGGEPRRLAGHQRRVAGALMLADGRRVLSWSWDGTLRVWDMESGDEQQRLLGHGRRIAGAKLLMDGKRVLSWSEGGTLLLGTVDCGEEQQRLAGHGLSVAGAVVLPDGRRALSWSGDGTLRVWDLEGREELQRLASHEQRVAGALMLSGSRALSWSDDTTLRVWDRRLAKEKFRLTGHEEAVTGAALLADGQRALSWSTDGTLRVWDLERGEELQRLAGHERRVSGAAVLVDGRRVLSWSEDQTLRLWDLECGAELRRLVGHSEWIEGAAVFSEGRRVLSWSEDGTLRVWDLECGKELQRLVGHCQWVEGAVALADERRAVSWAEDGTLRVWCLDRGSEQQRLVGHSHWVMGATVLRDQRRVLSWSEDRTLRVWDLEDGQELQRLTGHEHRVVGAIVLEDERRALSWSEDGTLRIWNLESGDELGRLEGHELGVVGAVAMADGRRVLSWSWDRTLRLWDLEKAALLSTYFGDARFCAPAIDENARCIVVGDILGFVHLLRIVA